MRDVHRETFPVSADTYWRSLCLSLQYQEQLYRECLGCDDMEVIENQGDADTGVRRSIRFSKRLEAPAPIRKLFGDKVTFEEIGHFDASERRFSFSMRPPMMGDNLRIEGSIQAIPTPDGACEVVTETRFDCDLFALGKLIEHFSAKSAREGQRDKASFTHEYIKKHGLK